MCRRVGKVALWSILWFLVVILVAPGQATGQEDTSRIVVNLPSRTLELYKENTIIKEYPITIGKPSTPTPVGDFSIIEKDINPCWYPPGKDYIVPSGPDNPLGYRWMGIGSMYGIHGTNTPWSIGYAVSNGCVRMQEESVEELFELVGCDTPVTIEYERIKVRVDGHGKASIGIYPDVYGRQRVTLASVKAVLAEAGMDGLADDSLLQSLIDEVPDRQVTFAQLHNLKINGVPRAERIVSWEGKKHVPVMALGDSLQASIKWDESSQTISRQNHIAPAIKRGNTVYVSVESLPALFGGKEVWNENENCLELLLPVAKYDGQLLTGDIQRVGDELSLSALAVARSIGERVKWQPASGQLVVHGKPAPVVIVGEEPFISVKNIGAIFNVSAIWNDQTQTIDLTYPLHPIDYSMYLDPGEEYL